MAELSRRTWASNSASAPVWTPSTARAGVSPRLRSLGQTGRPEDLRADWYIAVVPVEHMARLATLRLRQADPNLGLLDRLKTRWMNGIVFFLRRDVPMVHGHANHIDRRGRSLQSPRVSSGTGP